MTDIIVLFPLAFQFEVNGITASLNNERMLNFIELIYEKVDMLGDSFVSVDGSLSEKFQERSLEIQVSFSSLRLCCFSVSWFS